MADRPTPHVEEAFIQETRRVAARRVPLALGFVLGLVAVAGVLEWRYYPDRLGALAAAFVTELVLMGGALAVGREKRLRPVVVPILVAAMIGVAACIAAYVVVTGANGDALMLALIIFLPGVALLCPWGARGQVPLAVGTLAAYLVALASGVRGNLPLPYGILGVGGSAVTSILGAVFLDLHRRAIFRQRLLLEQTRDLQMTTLYDVTRTVTATLELPQVLSLVCQSVLHALGVDRLWLFWREARDGDLHGLAAVRDGTQVTLSELPEDRARWEALLRVGAHPVPALCAPSPEEMAVLERGGPPPARVLRLPLEFHSETVGLILADGSGARPTPDPNFLDFAATLGNSAAMAIANARLYALVLQHRAELQRLSNQRLDVVEEGMRRISHELHDGTCQALMAINIDLALLDRQAGTDATLRRAVRDIRAQILDVMHGVRQMSHLLHPPVLDDFGAVAAMESIAGKYREALGLDVSVECADAAMRFAPSIELLLFRVFQEALTNVLKHSGASRVQVRLAREPDAVRLDIEDDGHGFEASASLRTPPASGGLGLVSMRERVAHFGGTFQLTSRPGSGTRIAVRVPVERDAPEQVASAS